MGRIRSRFIATNITILAAIALLAALVIFGATVPSKTRTLGMQGACVPADTAVNQRYQRFFGGVNNENAFYKARYQPHVEPALACVRQLAGHSQTYKARLYLW